MEINSILKGQSRFAGFEVDHKISLHHEGEREVYLATDAEGTTVVLTVFNLGCERYKAASVDEVVEVRFLSSCGDNEGVARLLAKGDERDGDRLLGWMVQEYVPGVKLDESIQFMSDLEQTRPVGESVEIASRIAVTASLITKFTSDGGHYNICPSNVILTYDDEGALHRVTLIGTASMGEYHGGRSNVDFSALAPRYRAPESANGLYSSRTDVYSLGVILGELTAGCSDVKPRLTKLIDRMVRPGSQSRLESMEKFLYFISVITGTPVRKVEKPAPSVNVKKGEASEVKVKKTFGKEKVKGFAAVAGMEDLKSLFRRDFIEIVRNPEIADAYGIRPSNAMLLFGPQGCGKTFIAERAAQEAGLEYRVINPSDLGSVYIHGAQEKIAQAFAEAEKKAPMILIFDEFDALVPKRSGEQKDHQDGEVNEMLTQLNNCAERGIYCLCTSNRPDRIDPAVMRKGRIDRTIYVSLPDREARRELFRLELANRPLEDDVDYDALADATDHYTCSDISYIVEEAARQCFSATLAEGLTSPLPLKMSGLMDLVKATSPSVSESQRRDYLELKAKMEQRDADTRKKVGFV